MRAGGRGVVTHRVIKKPTVCVGHKIFVANPPRIATQSHLLIYEGLVAGSEVRSSSGTRPLKGILPSKMPYPEFLKDSEQFCGGAAPVIEESSVGSSRITSS